MALRHVANLTEFRSLIAVNKLTVCDFTASWCGPCKMIAPHFASLATNKPGVQFTKIDVDEQQEIAAQMGVRAMPTFFFFIKGKQVDKMEGADINRLQQLVDQYEKQVKPDAPPPIPSDVELNTMSAKQLLTLLAQHNISSAGLPEKQDLITELGKHRK